MEGGKKREPKAARNAAEAQQSIEPAISRHYKRRTHVWIRIEVDCWPGCRLLEHQGGRTEEKGWRHRSCAPGAGTAGLRHCGGLDDRRLGNGLERDLEAVRR